MRTKKDENQQALGWKNNFQPKLVWFYWLMVTKLDQPGLGWEELQPNV